MIHRLFITSLFTIITIVQTSSSSSSSSLNLEYHGIQALRKIGSHVEAYEAYLDVDDEETKRKLYPVIETLPYPDGTLPRKVVNRSLYHGEDIPIFVISMDKDLSRRRILANNVLSRVHNPVTFVRATPKDVFTDEFGTLFEVQKGWKLDSRFRDPDFDRTAFGAHFRSDYLAQFHFRAMKEGEIGLAISHYRVWAHAYHSGLPYVIVLEDDAEFSNVEKMDSFRIPDSLREKEDWDLLYFGGFEIDWPTRKGTKSKIKNDAKKVSHFLSGVAYALSRTGLEKVLCSGYHQNLIPLDEFLPALTSKGHFRMDIRHSLQVKEKLKAYVTSPVRIVESDTSMSDVKQNPEPYVALSCDPNMTKFREICVVTEGETKPLCDHFGHVVMRVDDRTSYFKIRKSKLLSKSNELWNAAVDFCETVVRRWWIERSQQRKRANLGDDLQQHNVDNEIDYLKKTCIDKAVQCGSIVLRNEKKIQSVQHTPQGSILVSTSSQEKNGIIMSRIADSLAEIVLNSLNETGTPSYHVIPSSKGKIRKDQEENERRRRRRRSVRPSVMIVDHLHKHFVASILRNWYNFVVDRYTNLPRSIVHHKSDDPNNLVYSIDLHDDGDLVNPSFMYDWSVLGFEDIKLTNMLFDQLCLKTRTGIVLRSSKELELISREFERRGFEIDVLASSKLQHDFTHTHQRLKHLKDMYVFRRKTSRPRQSWMMCNRKDECRWHAQLDFTFHLVSIGRDNSYQIPIVSHVKQGDSIVDKAVKTCRFYLGRYCTQGNRKLNLMFHGIFEAKDRGKCGYERNHAVLDGEVLVLNRLVMKCVSKYLGRWNELYGTLMRTEVEKF